MKELSSETRQVLQNAGMLTATAYTLRASAEKKGNHLRLPPFKPLSVCSSPPTVDHTVCTAESPSWVEGTASCTLKPRTV